MEEFLFGLIGGTALLMYGVSLMGDGLEKASGETMRKILTVLTGKVWSAFLVGIFVTAIVQSSTAVTVLTVGFVNSGLMQLHQAVGIIYGANIGTTITAQLMAFSFKFKLTDLALPILGVGFALNNISKNRKIKFFGQSIMGFGIMFLGLKILNDGIPYMEQSQAMRYFFANYASIPIVGLLLGALATAAVHSSAATIGLVMVLSQAGLLDMQTSLTIMLGTNIGTCITAQMASMTGNINARRTAWAHTLYNVIGVVIALIFMPAFMKVVIVITEAFNSQGGLSAYIANTHTLFNTLNAIIFLPLTNTYVGFLERVIRHDVKDFGEDTTLDRLLLNTPVAALQASRLELVRGMEYLKEMVIDVMNFAYTDDIEKMDNINEKENRINIMQKNLTRYIVELSRKKLTDSQSIVVPAIITSVNNIERSGDRVMEIASLCHKKINGHLSFTEEAVYELQEAEKTLVKMIDLTIICLKEPSSEIRQTMVELEEHLDEITEQFQENHISRLNEEICNVDAGVLFIDMIGHIERIGDHAYKLCMMTGDELFGVKREI